MGLCHRNQFEEATIGQQWDNFSKEKRLLGLKVIQYVQKLGIIRIQTKQSEKTHRSPLEVTGG